MRHLAAKGALPILLLATAGAARASETRFTPSVAVSEEANDNIREVPDGARAEFVTRVQPGGALHFAAPHTALDATYTLDYRYYARNTRGSEFNHVAGVKGLLGGGDDFLSLDASDSFSRVSLDLARDTAQESVLVNQTDQNVASISPYLTWHPGGKSQLKTGYRFTDTRYWESTAIDKRMHSVFADYAHQLSDRMVLTADYVFSRTSTEVNHYQEHDISAGVRYEYGEKSFLYGSIGNSWLDFSGGVSTSSIFWNAGITNDFGFLVGTAETKVQYTEDPLTLSTKETDYSVKLEKALARGRVGLGATYSEYDVTLDSAQNRRRFQVNLSGSHEVMTHLSASASLTGERASGSTAFRGLPYHLVATGALSYALGEGTSLGVTYSHVSYRAALGDSDGSIEVNRGVVEIRKVF